MDKSLSGAASDTVNLIQAYVPSLIGAVLILIVGWFVAAYLARLVERGLNKSNLGPRVAMAVATDDGTQPKKIERWISRGVFWLFMLFVLVGFFQVLGVSQVTEPITRFLNRIFEYLPRLIGPIVLVLVAWLLAKFLRVVVRKAVNASNIEKRMSGASAIDAGEKAPLADTLSDAAYWLTLLLFLPAVLSALDLGGLLEPVRDVVNEILGYMPNLLGAAVIMVVGWFVARVLRRIVTNLLSATGTDALAERVGIEKAVGDQKVSGLVGLIVYILVFVPVLVAALNALQIDAVTQPVSAMLNEVLSALPNIFAGALVLIIAYVVGRIVAGLSTNLLQGIGFDTVPQKIGLGGSSVTGTKTLSEIVGYLLLVTIMLFATIEALGLIGFTAFAALVADFLVFAARIVLGVVIIALGVFIGKVVADVVRSANPPQAEALANIARVAVIILAFAMGLEQMGVGEEIITLAFGLSVGAVAVAAAIAFGIGGRDIAADIIADWRARMSKK
tara:strand:- start:1085 stop:2593 length:1509 start_codon:yes stop_codon:yes gene_type:complete